MRFKAQKSNMKKLIATGIFLIFIVLGSYAQTRIAIIDTKFILEKIPAYKQAQIKLDNLSIAWQTTLDSMQYRVDDMKANFEAEQIMLSPELKTKRELEIANKDAEVKEYQRKKFGFEGELFKKRAELIKPIQDNVYASIQKL